MTKKPNYVGKSLFHLKLPQLIEVRASTPT